MRSDLTQLHSDAMGHTIMDQGTETSVINQLSAYNTALIDKVAALQEALKVSREKEAELEKSLADSGKEADDLETTPAAPNPFLTMTPQKILAYKKSVCGKKWPTSCASERSATTHATDGFLCDDNGIADMTIYKLKYKFLDAGPNEQGFTRHARCKAGKCEKNLRKLRSTPIKKISEIGALICQWALAAPKNVVIVVNRQRVQVRMEVIAAKRGAAVEDISLKLNIPIAAVAFQAMRGGNDGLSFQNSAVATKAIKDALAAAGAVESALHGKVCGHGFTSGSAEDIRANTATFRELVVGRAQLVSRVAMAQSGNSNIDTSDAVAHLVHVETQSAGIIIKLNGAHTDPCLEADWTGPPL